MNRHIKSAVISAVMIIFSISIAGLADAAIGMGDCGEIGGDCYSQGYFGITGGGSTWEIDTGTTLTAVDVSPAAYGIVMGYRFNKFIGLELVGNYFGEAEYDDTLSGNPLDTRICNSGLGMNFYLPLGRVIDDVNLDFISAYARGGMHYWDSEQEDPLTPLSAVTDDGVDMFYAFGINVDLKRHFAIRAEHSVYEIGDTNSVDIDAITFILKF